MNVYEPIRNKNRRKTEERKLPKIELNISKINQSKLKHSITPRKKRKSNNSRNIQTNLKNINIHPLIKKKLIRNHISTKSLGFRSNSVYNSFLKGNDENFKNKNDNNKVESSRRHSLEIVQMKTKKFFRKYSLKINENKEYKKTSHDLEENPLSKVQLNLLENNIKNALNNMRIQIEKNNQISIGESTITPATKFNKLTSSPNLKFLFLKKKNKKGSSKAKKYLQSSVLMKETCIDDFSFKKNIKNKRSRSLEFNEKTKKKLFNKIKNKMKKSNNKLSFINKSNSFHEDDSDNNNENYKGLAFLPTSRVIFTLDLLIILADLYTFIFIPLSIAKNKDIKENYSLFMEILHFLIDLIFILDFVVSLFRGYYNYEMDIIRNNKKIISEYMQNFFFIDLIQAIPLYSIIRISFKKHKKYFYGYNDSETLIITFLLLIKPFKIFKIIKKKQNKALEDFYSYLSEKSYYLEQLTKFLIYFLIFFLFIHLFICLHIYFTFHSYPNWIVHTNIINDTFFGKYVASLYFMITTMTTVGYGDIVCISFIERIYHIILLVIGTLLYTFLVSKIGNYLRDQSHEQIKLGKDLNILENIRITYPAMPFKLYSKIKNHLQSIFNKRKKTGLSLLINGVPDAIKNDLLFKIYSKIIQDFKIFKDVKNSNFVLQILTNFIPIVSKKEETIALEGETIQNMIFVKDGRLSIEVSVDLNDPYISIQKYLEANFTGMDNQEDSKNIYNLNKSISIMNMPERNFNDLKAEIDNVILDNQNTLVNNSRIDNNGISVDLGRLDFSRNEIENIENENIQSIKIIDIRKNEHYGDVHILTGSPSPFTIKAKSRVAELLLLRKHDVITISKNFPNIWGRIKNKSYHNLMSIKKLTIKTLKRYYNIYFYNKEKKENNPLNFDISRLSGRSNLDNNISILRAINKNNISVNKNVLSRNIKSIKSQNSIKSNNKLFIGYEGKRKISGERFSNELNFSSESFDSNSFDSNDQNLKSNKSKNTKNFTPILNIERAEENKMKGTDISKYKKSSMNNLDKFTFNNESENNKFNPDSPKKAIMKSKSKYSKFNTTKKNKDLNTNYENTIIKSQNNSSNPSGKNLNTNISINKTQKYHNQDTREIANDNNSTNILTLDDINQYFSKKVKKRIKKRKRIQKLRELLRFQRLKISKNLLEFLSKKFDTSNDIMIRNENNLNYSVSSFNNKIFSNILDSTTSEGGGSTINISNQKFEKEFIKINSESFEIKASYKNINLLTKGKIIKNIKYKLFIENMIKNYNDTNFEKDSSENLISSTSLRSKAKKNEGEKNNEINTIKNNDESFYSESNNTPISKFKNQKIISEDTTRLSNKKLNSKKEKATEAFFENNNSKNDFINLKNYYSKSNSLNWNLEGKYLTKIKKDDNTKNKIQNDNNNNKDIENKSSIKSSLNVFKEYDKYYNSTGENKLSILNNNTNTNSCTKMIKVNKYEEKTRKCIIF